MFTFFNVFHVEFTSSKLPLDIGMFLDGLVRFRHHGNEHVQQHDDTSDIECAIDQVANALGKGIVVAIQFDSIFLREPE